MLIKDRVYGEIEITDQVILDLIKSKPMQRLKGIAQAGISKYVFKNRSVTRFEHSLGVMILLKKLGASVEEQIAGLLHDIPHTAFSHVIDYVFKSKDHDFHEKFHEKIINNSEIPKILKEHDLDPKFITNEHNFPLLEKNAPDLCADRLDYTFRDLAEFYSSTEKLKDCITKLIIENNEIIFADKESAVLFANLYLDWAEKTASNPIDVALYELLAQALKIALKENIITEKDLFENDEFVMNKLKESNNQEIKTKLEMINPNLKIIDDSEDCHFQSAAKLRFVDPKFLTKDNQLKRASEVSQEFKQRLQQHKEEITKGNYIKIVSW